MEDLEIFENTVD